MQFDLVVKNGRIVDGSGMPAYQGDIGVKNGRIVEIGRIDGSAHRTLNAEGKVVAPGFIDIHTHFDAQVTWDPLCTFSCYHGVTTVIFGNCSLALAPVGTGEQERYWLAQMLAYVEAIPLEDLQAGINWAWHSIGEYMEALDRCLGVNVGCLIGHSAVRRKVMGDKSQVRVATQKEIREMGKIILDGMESGALGISFSRSASHKDLEGRPDPGSVAAADELFALARTIGEYGAGCIQVSNGSPYEMSEGMCTKLFQESGLPVTYNAINHFWNAPHLWEEQLSLVAETVGRGNRAFPQTNTRPADQHFTFKNCPLFRSFPDWDLVMAGTTEEKLAALNDPAIREKLRNSISGPLSERTFFNRRWDLMEVNKPALKRNSNLAGKSIEEIASDRQVDPFDVFLDLAIEEELNTWFVARKVMGGGDEAQTVLLNSPHTVLGLSDAGAHVTYDPGYGATTFLLSYWVREQNALSLEEAIRQVTFVPATLFGMYERGLLQPGLMADMVIFDPEVIDLEEVEEVHDLPAGGARLKQLARGIEWTIVNGEVLIERGEHTGAYPGKVVRNSRYRSKPGSR